MKFKLDENLGNDIAKLLRRAGHNVSTVPSQKLCSKPDTTIIEACRKEKRCLITLDLEFGNPFLFKPSHYSGIAVLCLPKKPVPKDLYDCVQTLINEVKRSDIIGELWIVQRGRIRIYQEEDAMIEKLFSEN